MGRDKRNEKRERERFTSWIASEKCLPSWKALSFSSREAYHHLRIRCFAETKKLNNNNGEIFRSNLTDQIRYQFNVIQNSNLL